MHFRTFAFRIHRYLHYLGYCKPDPKALGGFYVVHSPFSIGIAYFPCLSFQACMLEVNLSA